MTYKIRMAVLLLVVLFLVPGAPVGLTGAVTTARTAVASPPLQPASVTVPGASSPVVVQDAASLNTRGWAEGSAAVAGSSDIAADVLDAYAFAVAASPVGCRLPVSLLAAIGQVESGNLAGHRLDANHRVVPAILGPVLDGTSFLAVKDTDAGQWDGDPVWDRALGPLQLIPASWRAVGVDMDGDGLRDPQDLDDAAGAAMVYLCAGGRDLGTAAGLRDAVLSYNHSTDYLNTVLAWKSVFDAADLSQLESLPVFDAQELPSVVAAALPSPTPAGATRVPAQAKAGRPTATARPVTPGATSATTPTTTPSTAVGPSTPPETTKPSVPADSPSPSPDPTPTPDPIPGPGPGPVDPTPLPTCPLPSPTDAAGPDAASPDPSTTPSPSDLPADPATAVPGAPTVDADGNACVPLVDPITGEPLLSGGTDPAASQTQSADPGTP